MTLATILNFSRTQCQTDSNGLTDTIGIVFANEALQDFHRQLVNRGVDASQLQETYRDGSIPAAGNGATFLYPTDMLFLKSIEVNFTDTNANNYRVATQVDVSNLAGNNSFSYLRQNANKFNPFFDDRGDWYEIFPAFQSGDNLSQAIRIFYFLKPTEYVATSDTVVYPENLDTTILGWRIAASYLYSLQDSSSMAAADKFMSKYIERVEQYIATLGRGIQTPNQATPLQITGWEF